MSIVSVEQRRDLELVGAVEATSIGSACASKKSRMISQITDTLGSYMTAPTFSMGRVIRTPPVRTARGR